jgi:triosephosphate isomerase (TIM)
MKYLIANWKSHKTLSEAKAWANTIILSPLYHEFQNGKHGQLQVVLCPAFPHFQQLQQLLPNLSLGAQTLSPFSDGSYTGAVSARQINQQVQFAILGHVERRKYFQETDQVVAQQAIQALDNEITPIVAVDKSNWSSQLSQFDKDQLKPMLVMYEPSEAISTTNGGRPADLQEVKEAIRLIKADYPVMGVLYGGSVNSQNIAQYIGEADIDGVVPGAASLEAEEFLAMIQAAQSVL